MATAADEAAIGYLVSLPTKEQRRTVASVSRWELLTAVRALAGCQRCGFLQQVLAAFDPELATAAAPPLGLEASDWFPVAPTAEVATAAAGVGPSAAGASALAGGLGQDLSPASPAAVPLTSALSTTAAAAGVAAAPTAAEVLPPHPPGAAAGVMAPARVLELLSKRGGSSDLVGLMQFAWRGTSSSNSRGSDGPDGRRGGGDGGGGGSSGDRLSLGDSLLSRPRLLRRFLVESVGFMQALADDVGDCRRHTGYPGPAELASTLARLDMQRCHTLQRLAAWGVLRAPPLPPAGSTLVCRAAADRAQANSADSDVSAEEAAAEQADGDPQLALAIQFSLRGRGASPHTVDQLLPPPPSPPPAEGCSPGVSGRELSQQRPQPHAGTPRRVLRTPPRPTGGALAPVAADGLGARGSPSVRGLASWSGPGPGWSPPYTTAGRSPGAAALGLGECGAQQNGADATVGTLAARALAASPTAAAASPSDVTQQPTQSPTLQQQLPSHTQQQRLPKANEPAELMSVVPLPVSEAEAAAEGLADASVLVDDAAVAALSEGLRERVQHLVAQLVQVQQRRGRLEHACQHGILAAGRKLLLILLQMLWAELRRAATTAAAAEAVVEMAEATGSDVAGAGMAAPRVAAPSPPPPAQPASPAQRQRRSRYAGLLADLAAGLGEDDTYLDLDLYLDAGPLADLGLGLDPVADLDQDDGDAAAAGEGGGGAISGGGWDAALVAAGGGGGAYERQSVALPAIAAAEPLRPSSMARLSSSLSSAPTVGRHAAALRSAVPSPALRGPGAADAALQGAGWPTGGPATGWLAGEGVGGRGTSGRAGALLESSGFSGRAPRLAGGDCSCQPGCAAAREQQAEQLRVLQGQLSRCQASQSELQGEVGRLLDMLAEQRRTQEQATGTLRRELAQWQAEPAALQGLGAEELGALAGRLEAALSRVRAAQLQAAAERDLVCPVCWERRKGLVFGCGHQTCCACGERLSACPICREPVSLRIRVYS